MESGVALALNEITLVVFTTLAPSGAVALCVMVACALRPSLDEAVRTRINQFACVPLVVSMIGLLMSATHLGNPANVLYVFARTGASPLSTEVAAAAVFLALAGVYWLYGFSQKPNAAVQRVWVALICAAGVVFVTMIALAYRAPGVIGWDTPFVPVILWLNALVGGPLLALASLKFAQAPFARGGFALVLLGVSAAALGANVVACVMQNAGLAGISNEFSTVADLVPFYGAAIGALAVCAAAGIFLLFAVRNKSGKRVMAAAALACAFVFAGIFATRFCFYAMHMTVGLGM